MDNQDLAKKLAQLTPKQRQFLQQRLGASSRRKTGSEIIAQGLKELGITHAYGISGVPVDRLLGQCAKVGIRVIGVRHQQAATLMAVAQNYVAGSLVAVVIVSSGPGITNTITGALVAWDNLWPLLIIGGGSGNCPPGTFQELPATTLFAPITKASLHITTCDEIAPLLTHAAQIAINDRPGPVFIDIAASVFSDTISSLLALLDPPHRQSFPVDPTDIAKAAQVLQQAERPLLVIGQEIRWSEAHTELAQLVSLGIPFIATPMARGYLPDDDPHHVSPAAATALGTADIVVSVGARWNWTLRFGSELAKTTDLIQIDIHAPEIEPNVDPKVTITGDAKFIVQELLTQLGHTGWQTKAATTVWRNSLREACQSKRYQWLKGVDPTQSPMWLQTLMVTLSTILPRDAITILDGNYTLEAGIRLLPCYTPVSRFTPGTNGCMGTGIPFAIGAKIAHPDRVVVAICGDLSFGMAAMELETAVRHQIPIIIIVANNQGNAGSHRQNEFYGSDYPERVTMFVPDAHYEMIALAFGGFGAEVYTVDELKITVKEAISSHKTACINVHIDPDAPSPRL